MTVRIGCSFLFPSCFEINGYDESFCGAGYQDLDLVCRLEALVEHRFWEEMVAAPSFFV